MKIFWPILKFFETDEEPVNYRASHRVALNVVGVLFLVLSLGAGLMISYSDDLGYLIPVIFFFCMGFVALVVGLFGSNGAVSKIWGSR